MLLEHLRSTASGAWRRVAGLAGGDGQRRVTTLVFTDIVDSTALAAGLGDEAWTQLLDEHHALLNREVRRGGGREVKRMGDGMLAAFTAPSAALRSAQAAVEGVRALGIDIRVGLHAGEVRWRRGDVVGLAVNVTHRVATSADPGEVRISCTVRDLLAGAGLAFVPRGAVHLNGSGGTWETFGVGSRLDGAPVGVSAGR